MPRVNQGVRSGAGVSKRSLAAPQASRLAPPGLSLKNSYQGSPVHPPPL